MNYNDIIDLTSPQWQSLYKVIYEILPPLTTEVELSVFESSSRHIDPMKLREKTAEEFFPDREMLYHVSNHVNTFMVGAWWPLVERETFCAVFVGQDNKLYYIGDSSFASNVLEIPETEWTVLDHHIPIAPITTYYQLMAFLMFFNSDDSMPSVKTRLEELIDGWSGLPPDQMSPDSVSFVGGGIPTPDAQEITDALIDTPAVSKVMSWDNISSIVDNQSDDVSITPSNIERLNARKSELLEAQHEPKSKRWGITLVEIAVGITVCYGLYRMLRR